MCINVYTECCFNFQQGIESMQHVYKPLPHASFISSSGCILQVFLDEINTSSCGGLLKEIITDQSLDGKVIICVA